MRFRCAASDKCGNANIPQPIKTMNMTRLFKYFLVIFGTMTIAACSSEPESATGTGTPDMTVKFSAEMKIPEDYENTSVLVFRKKNGAYLLDSKFDGPWSVNGHATAILELGDYRFLFFRSPSVSTDLSPLITGTTTPDDIQFIAKQNADGSLLPVDEIFLPVAAEIGNEYHIEDGTTVTSKLSRAVSRIDIWIKRGRYDGETFSAIPYTGGRTILDNLDYLELKISGISTIINLSGAQGNGTMNIGFSSSDVKEITSEGFALFTGPLVFPPSENGNVTVNAIFRTKNGSSFPDMQGSATSTLEKNNVLSVTLWITNDYKFLDIVTVTRPIEAETDGDSGVWH